MIFGSEGGPIFRGSVVFTKVILKSVPPLHHPPLITRNWLAPKSMAPEVEDISWDAAKTNTQRVMPQRLFSEFV